MPNREIKDDFEKLKIFVENYHIVSASESDKFMLNLAVGHKRLLALLTFVAEIESTNKDTGFYSEDSLKYFAESSSDVSQSFFCWMHGAYKPAYLALRSSIETFIKALVGTENPRVLTQKNMYKLLDLASESKACSGLAKQYFSNTKSSYKELCAIAHSAMAAKFTQVNAFQLFPKYEEKDAKDFIGRFVKLVDQYMAILIASNRSLIAKMHFRNRQTIFDTLTQDIKRTILGEEAE